MPQFSEEVKKQHTYCLTQLHGENIIIIIVITISSYIFICIILEEGCKLFVYGVATQTPKEDLQAEFERFLYYDVVEIDNFGDIA